WLSCTQLLPQGRDEWRGQHTCQRADHRDPPDWERPSTEVTIDPVLDEDRDGGELLEQEAEVQTSREEQRNICTYPPLLRPGDLLRGEHHTQLDRGGDEGDHSGTCGEALCGEKAGRRGDDDGEDGDDGRDDGVTCTRA